MIKHRTSVLDFDPVLWDQLAVGADIALSHGWVMTAEATGDAETVYFTSEDKDGVAAILPATIATQDSPWLLTRTDSVLAQCVGDGDEDATRIHDSLAADPSEALLPGLVLGGRHAGRTSVIGDSRLTASMVDQILASAEEFARHRGLRSLAFLYVDARDEILLDCLGKRGYERWGSGTDSDLTLPGDGFEAYLSQFPSRRRSKIRNDRKLVESSDFRIRRAELSEEILRRAAELESILFAKYGIEDWTPERSYRGLVGARDNLNNPFMMVAENPAGDMIGFSFVAEFHDEWYAVRAGFDYEKQSGVPLYYELVYYTLIDMADAHDIKKIHYGMGSVEAKALRGCVGTAQYGYVKVLSRKP